MPHLLVYLGEMCVQDGVDHLVRALRILRDEQGRNDFHCVLVGGGPHQRPIQEYALEQGVGDLCTFTGRVSDEQLCRILSSADLAVDPDPKTAWADLSTMNKVMEYMYFGLPIVAYDLRETSYSAQRAAVYARANDEADLARKISALLDAPEERAEMGSYGRARVRTALAWEFSVPPLLAAYDRAFGSRMELRSVGARV
jgi:glycosyltransferase involved in cell wall biosynthesis